MVPARHRREYLKNPRALPPVKAPLPRPALCELNALTLARRKVGAVQLTRRLPPPRIPRPAPNATPAGSRARLASHSHAASVKRLALIAVRPGRVGPSANVVAVLRLGSTARPQRRTPRSTDHHITIILNSHRGTGIPARTSRPACHACPVVNDEVAVPLHCGKTSAGYRT